MESVEIKKLEGAIEAILFTMGDSVELGKIAAAVEHDEDTVRKIIHQMMDKYEEEDRGVRIVELENSFQMCTKPEMYEYLIRVARQPRQESPTVISVTGHSSQAMGSTSTTLGLVLSPPMASFTRLLMMARSL